MTVQQFKISTSDVTFTMRLTNTYNATNHYNNTTNHYNNTINHYNNATNHYNNTTNHYNVNVNVPVNGTVD
jgi:hypothetical protein